MTLNSNGILAIWHDLDPSFVCDFREWHFREHMPERLSVPGFLLGCRYESVGPSPVIFNYYLTESPATLTSEPYLERLNKPSDWTTRMMPALRDVYRAAGRVTTTAGEGQGGAVATLRFSSREGCRQDLQAWLSENGLNQLLDQSGINRTHLWQADNSASAVETVESTARGGNAAVLDWTVAIEGVDPEYVQAAADWLQQQQPFVETLQGTPLVGAYRLVHRLGL